MRAIRKSSGIDQFWTVAKIKEVKAAIRAELERDEFSYDPKQRLKHILEQIDATKNATATEILARCFVYTMSALVHHIKFGGLTNTQISSAAEIAFIILRTQGIEPGKSRIASLHGEVHLALSKIYGQSGKSFLSAWQDQLSKQAAAMSPLGTSGFEAFTAGNRLQRLGHLAKACDLYHDAMQLGLTDVQMLKCHIELIRSLRLMGKTDESEAYSQSVKSAFAKSTEAQGELVWEEALRAVKKSKELTEISRLLRRSGFHYQEGYLIEGYFWTRCSQTQRWVNLPKPQSIARRNDMDPATVLGVFYRIAQVLDQCYDVSIPLNVRISKLGEIIEQRYLLISVDKELLMWAAAARFLANSKSHFLAAICTREYRNLCMIISGFHDSDVLGIMSDLYERDWMNQESFLPAAS